MAATVVRTASRSGFLAAVLGLCALSALPAAAQPVDTFDTDQAALSDPPGGASSVATVGTDILGLTRGLVVRRWSGPGPVTAGVASGALTVSISGTTPDSRGEAVVTWDGDSNALMLSPTGLGGVDLTAGDAFRLTVVSATAGVELAFTVYTDAGNASVAGLVLPAIAATTDIDVPFASFVTAAGTGASFANVGAVALAVRGTEEMLVLGGVEVVTSTATVSATLTDNVVSAQPGETLNYAARLSNTGPGTASNLALSNPLDADTTLVAGSVEVSPLAFDDQYAGALVGTDLSVAAPGVLFNDVDGDGDALVVAPTGARPTAQGGSATVNADGSFTYTPPAAFQGLDTFDYQADDGNGITGPGVATIHVGCAAITVAPTTLDPGTVGTPYVPVTFMATGASGAVAWSVMGALPAGMNFSAAGVLDGTPTAGGSFALTFVAMDAAGCTGSQAITLVVNSAPTISSANATTFTVGQAGSFTVTTTGFPAPSIAIGGVALPGTLTFLDNGDGTGTLSGTPDPGTGGTYTLTFTATNIVGSSAPQSFTLTVNEAPAITSDNNVTFTVGQAGTFEVTTTGFPPPSIARGGVALPGGVSFLDNGDGTGTLSGTPDAGAGGTYMITFTATNVVGSTPAQSFTLTVNEAPEITSADNDTFVVGTADSFTVTATGFPAPTVAHTSGGLPTGITFTPATRVLGGTAQQTGDFPLQFTATNGVNPDDVEGFTLHVVCPTITVSGSGLNDGLYNVAYTGPTFTQSGSTGSTITWSATGLPAGLAIGASTGQVSGTPTDTVLTGSVTITATDNFGCFGNLGRTITVRPNPDAETFNGGVGNTQYVVGAAPPGTPHVFVNENVLTGDQGPAALSVAFPATSVNGGTIAEGTVDGTFVYTPALAFIGPSDSFSYTLTDGNNVTNTATVTINLSNLVWYVNSSGANGDGRSHNPFNTLANAETPAGAGSTIFVHTGAATTTGNLALDANQTLWGQGATFTLNSLTILGGVAGTPTLTGNVTLANNTAVNSINFTPSGVALTAGVAVTQPVTINQVGVTGGTSALSLTNVTGAVTVTNSSFSNGSNAEVLISQGTAAVSVGATISNNFGRAIDVQGRTGGTVTFSGAVTDTGGTGILLNNNTGASSIFAFTGGITLNGSNSTFTATSSGTLTITGTNRIGQTTPPTSTALNVASTVIGVAGLTFERISATGATNGIVLNTTGPSGGLTVTGDGGGSNNGSGGTIQTTTAEGILLSSTTNVSLGYLNITNPGTDGIRITNINGFTLNRSNVSDSSGTAPADKAIDVGDFSTGTAVNGTINITNNVIGPAAGNSPHDSLAVGIGSGTSTWAVTGTTFRNTGNSGINLELRGTAVVSAFNVSNCTFAGAGFATSARGIFANNLDDSVMTLLTIQNSSFTNNNIHIDVNQQNDTDPVGGSTFRILNNTTMTGARSHAINVFAAAGAFGGTLTGRIEGNVIGNAGVAGSGSAIGNGIRVNVNGGSDATLLLNNNTVRQTPNGRGIEIIGRNGTGGLDVTVTNNDVNPQALASPLAAILVQSNCVTTCNTVRSDVRNNIVPAATDVTDFLTTYIELVESGASTLELVDSPPVSANCAAQLAGTNTGSTGVLGACALIPGPISTPP